MSLRNIILLVIPLNLLVMQVIAIRKACRMGKKEDLLKVRFVRFLDTYLPSTLKIWFLVITILCLVGAFLLKN